MEAIIMKSHHATSVLSLLLGIAFAAFAGAVEVGDYVEVTVDQTPIFDGEETLAKVNIGDKFEVEKINGDFFGVRVMTEKGRKFGYLWNKRTKISSPPRRELYTPPAPDKYVRVTASDADIRAGKTKVASVAKGDVLLIKQEQPGWIWVQTSHEKSAQTGWISEKSVERLPHLGPSIHGFWPNSIHDASVQFDGNKFTIEADLTGYSDENLSAYGGDITDADVVLQDGRVKVWVSDEIALTPRTNSLWLVGDNDFRHRLDLPTPTLTATAKSHRYDTFSEGQFFSVEIDTPVPGMWVEGCQIVPGQDNPTLRRLDRGIRAEVSFSDFYQFDGKTFARIRLRDLSDELPRWLYFRLCTPWGAMSDSVVFKRTADEMSENGTLFSDASPGQSDAVAKVPNVELMPVELASEVLETAGFEAQYISADDLQKIAYPDPQKLVTRQGVTPGDPQLLGELVLLSIGSTSTVNNSGDRSRLTIDVPDALSLVWLDEPTVPRFSLDESEMHWLTSSQDASGVISIGTDGGISLNADRTEQETMQAAYLKLLLVSTLEKPLDAMPGALGEVFRHVIANEEKIQQTISESEVVPIAEIAHPIVEDLNIGWTTEDLGQLESDWSRFARYRYVASDFDLQGNGFVTDDLAIWIIFWLFEHGFYDPFQSTLPACDVQGRPLVVLYPPGQSPEWGRGLDLPISPPGIQAPSPLDISKLLGSLRHHAPLTTEPTPEKAISTKPPTGDPVTFGSDGPTRVRVPRIRLATVDKADNELSKLGLRIANADRYLVKDRVTDVSPNEQSWVDSGSSVDLDAERLVPEVLGYTPSRVSEELKRWGFKSRNLGRVLSNDVAVDQSPESGQYASVNIPIDISYSAIVPPLVGKLAEQGLEDLEERELKYQVQTKIFLQDKIVDQSPDAGSLVSHGDSVDLVVHTRVPNITGRNLGSARRTLQDFDLVPSMSHLARDEDIVRGQGRDAGTYVPHGSNVSLAPVVTTVPNVVGRRFDDAKTILDTRNDIRVRMIGDLLARDRITRQTPRAGIEIERGDNVTVDARVPTPNVRGNNLFAASNTIRNWEGELMSNVIGFSQQTDVVYSQSPNPDVLVMPRSTISLVPGVNIPNVRGLSVNEAKHRMENVNVNSWVNSSGTQETTNRELAGQVVVSGQSHVGLHPRNNVGQVNLSATSYILATRRVPGVHEMQALAAINAIENADLRVGTVIVNYSGVRIPPKRMSVTQFRSFLLGQAISSLLGLDSEGARISWNHADYTQPRARTVLVANDQVDLYVNIGIEQPGK